MPKMHKIEIGNSVLNKSGGMGVMYVNDRRVAGGKPYGGFRVAKTYMISDEDLREAMRNAETTE